MSRATLAARIERWPVRGAFTIARRSSTSVDAVVVEIARDGVIGRGEGTPVYYHGESAESVLAAVLGQADAIAGGMDREELQLRLPRGAARNALDCAMWDLAAKRGAVPVWRLAGLAEPRPCITAFTISLGSPDRMEADARAAAHRPLLKLKLTGADDAERVAAVRRGAPDARLIVDANEAWTGLDVAAEAGRLVPYGVELIEQPVRRGEDQLLNGIGSPIPLCADESCQDRTDLTQCVSRYDAINIKLDKTGGLTEAIALARAAQGTGVEIMLGCMLATSLGIAPAFLLAGEARWADLDGALLLADDRDQALQERDGILSPPRSLLWG